MTATAARPRRAATPKDRPASARQVRGMLLGLAYRLHATQVVKRLPARGEQS